MAKEKLLGRLGRGSLENLEMSVCKRKSQYSTWHVSLNAKGPESKHNSLSWEKIEISIVTRPMNHVTHG